MTQVIWKNICIECEGMCTRWLWECVATYTCNLAWICMHSMKPNFLLLLYNLYLYWSRKHNCCPLTFVIVHGQPHCEQIRHFVICEKFTYQSRTNNKLYMCEFLVQFIFILHCYVLFLIINKIMKQDKMEKKRIFFLESMSEHCLLWIIEGEFSWVLKYRIVAMLTGSVPVWTVYMCKLLLSFSAAVDAHNMCKLNCHFHQWPQRLFSTVSF